MSSNTCVSIVGLWSRTRYARSLRVEGLTRRRERVVEDEVWRGGGVEAVDVEGGGGVLGEFLALVLGT